MNSNPNEADSNSNQLTSLDVAVPLSRYVLFFALATIGCLTDLISKSWVFATYFDPTSYELGEAQEVRYLLEGIFGLQTSTNPGALFGMGAGYSWLFAIISFFAIGAVILWLFVWRAALDRWLTFALGLITGGILGNLYDRLGFGWDPSFPEEIKTHVRDFIYFRLEGVYMFNPWPNFNIADTLLVTGAIMLFIHAIFMQPSEPAEKSDAARNSNS